MPLVINRLSFKNKLILFAAIPMLSLTLLGSIIMIDLWHTYQAAQNNTLIIEFTQDIENLVDELQKERGLTAGFISSKGEQYRQQLSEQEQHTDNRLTQLQSKINLEKLFDANTEQILLLTENMDRIRHINQELLLARQDIKSHSTDSFQFFTELINHLLILISQLQIQIQIQDGSQASSYHTLIHLLHIQELAGQERGLVNSLLSAKVITTDAFITMNAAEDDLELAINQTLSTTEVAYKLYVKELLSSSTNLEYLSMREQIKSQIELIRQTKELTSLLGYGGVIHHFKNYLLRGEPEYVELFNNSIQQAETKLLRLRQHTLTAEQLSAIDQISYTLNQYREKLTRLTQLKHQGVAIQIQAQDAQVRIDDTPMLESLAQLQHQSPIVSSEEWWNTASQRIEKLHQISTDISSDIAQLGELQKNRALTYLAIGVISSIINVLLMFLLGRAMVRNLVGSVSAIARDMQRMTQDPHLDLTVTVEGDDEIAQMSQALNQMLKERVKANSQLNLAAAVFEYSAEGIVITDHNNLIELINPSFTKITGYSLDEVKGKDPSILKSDMHSNDHYQAMWSSLNTTDKWEGEIWNKRKNGQVYPEYLAITVVRNDTGNITQHIGLFLDISNHKKYEQDIWYKTNYDALTNLPNHHLYSARLQQELLLTKQRSSQLAILFIDLDRFKYINDIYGHTLGNELLHQVATRLERLLEKHDFIARFSGDEFAIIKTKVETLDQINTLTNSILKHISAPFELGHHELMISASIGISLYPENGDEPEQLTRYAETAMYKAKRDGRSSYRYFSPEMNVSMLEHIQLEQRLRRAVLQGEFFLCYQPLVNLSDRSIIGVEALIRWQDPKFGLISPEQFIPMAEETGLIEPIGEWVIEQALIDLHVWHSMGYMINMAVNVSGRQLINNNQTDFDLVIDKLLKKYDIKPKHLHIEITESMLMDDTEQCLHALKAIRDLGMDIYIDDFGTGYSSLSYLKRFPISVIKIDKSFVDNMLECQSDANLIKAIVMMGKSLELKLVAEGIETEEQLQFLKSLGCDFGQGYLISHPLPNQELTALLEKSYFPQFLYHDNLTEIPNT